MKNDLALLTLTHECKTLVHSMARTKQHVCYHIINYVIHQNLTNRCNQANGPTFTHLFVRI